MDLKDGMGLRVKNLNIMGVHSKIRFLGEGGHEKPIYRRELLKRRAGTVFRFKGELGKKEGGGWGLIPQCTLMVPRRGYVFQILKFSPDCTYYKDFNQCTF